MSMLSRDELEKLAEAASSAFPGPLPTQVVSSDEFFPIPQTPRQKKVEALVKELGAQHAMRNGMPRDTPEVQFVKAITVKARGDAQVQVDGELIGHLPMRFEIAPDSLDVIVP